MVIYKSSNEPMIINFTIDKTSLLALEIELIGYFNGPKNIKVWNIDDLIFNGDYIIIPLSQTDTASWPVCNAVLEVKGMTTEGKVFWCDDVEIKIKNKNNLNILGDDILNIDYASIDIDELIADNTPVIEGLGDSSNVKIILQSMINNIIKLIPKWEENQTTT